MPWLLLGAAAGLAAGIDPISYAELLNLKENSLINESAYGSWTAPHGGAVYCAAPITVEGSDGTGRVDLFAVGYDCCGGSDEIEPPAYLNSTLNATDNSTVTTYHSGTAPEKYFSCAPQIQDRVAAPEAPNGDAVPAGFVGLAIPRKEKELFLKAAKRSPAWWINRTDWSPDPLVIYVVKDAVVHCSKTNMSVCGESRNKDECPEPVAAAIDLTCPGQAACYRSFDGASGQYQHACAPRTFRNRFIPDESKEPAEAWWEEWRHGRGNANHPNAPGAPLRGYQEQSLSDWPGDWTHRHHPDIRAVTAAGAGLGVAASGAATVVGALPAVAGLGAAGSVGGAAAGVGTWQALNPHSHYDPNNPGSKWATPEDRMWRAQISEAPEWSSPGADPKWRRPSGEMWQPDGPHVSSSKPPEDYINAQPRVLHHASEPKRVVHHASNPPSAAVTPTLRGPKGEVWAPKKLRGSFV